MKVLPMQQPWASLVMLGIKTTETRGAHTSHRGETLVLATKSRPSLLAAPAAWDVLADALEVDAGDLANSSDYDVELLHLGKILGSVWIADSVSNAEVEFADLRKREGAPGWHRTPHRLYVDERQRPLGHFGPGRRVWPVYGAATIEQPVICRGMPGMFEAPPMVEAAVVEQLRGARR